MVDNNVLATIKNSGVANLFVTFATGKHNLKCGNITQNFTVTDYTPKFTINSYTADAGDQVKLSTSH